MQTPQSLVSLVDEGLIDEVLRPLMSGKEAQVFLVRSGGEQRVAKVYKDAQHRSFKQRAEYTEGRNVRNSRDQRAMTKRTRHGRAQDEAAWRTAEVDMIYRLRTAGVRVPVPYHFVDGVLIMELVTDADGHPAPRLGDLNLDPEGAQVVFDRVLAEVVRMLAAGVVHGDLSDFNVLMGTDGPVIIDFPQAVDASGNQNARKLLVRDVDNLHRFISKVIPGRQPPPFAQEMWQLYERGELTADTKLKGRYRAPEKRVNTEDVSSLIADAERDERKRRESLGQRMRGGAEPSHSSSQPSSQRAQPAQYSQPNHRAQPAHRAQPGPYSQPNQRAQPAHRSQPVHPPSHRAQPAHRPQPAPPQPAQRTQPPPRRYEALPPQGTRPPAPVHGARPPAPVHGARPPAPVHGVRPPAPAHSARPPAPAHGTHRTQGAQQPIQEGAPAAKRKRRRRRRKTPAGSAVRTPD